MTGSLDDAQLRALDERLTYLRELDARRDAIFSSIAEQGKLTRSWPPRSTQQTPRPDSRTSICRTSPSGAPRRRSPVRQASNRSPTPCSPTRRSTPPRLPPDTWGVGGRCGRCARRARHIVVERAAEDAELVGAVRTKFWGQGALRTAPRSKTSPKCCRTKFRDYFEFSEPLTEAPSHRVLAVLRRGEGEILSVTLDGGEDAEYQVMIADALGVDLAAGGAATPWLTQAVRWAWRTKLMVTASIDARMQLRKRAEDDAVNVFARNLRICCSPRRPVLVRLSVLTPASVPV